MPTCWKCEKELPEGQVECEPSCNFAPEDRAEKTLVIQLGICPRPEVMADIVQLAAFNAALEQFMSRVAYDFTKSGLATCCQPPK